MVRECSDDGAGQTSQPGGPVSPELASIDAMENGLALTPEVGRPGSTDGVARKHAAAALTDGTGAVGMVALAEAGQARASPQSVTEGPPRRSTLKDTGSSLGSSLKSVHSDGVTPTPNP